MSHPDNETVMAASERLMELAEQADDLIMAQETEDRLWEIADFRLVRPEEPDGNLRH